MMSERVEEPVSTAFSKMLHSSKAMAVREEELRRQSSVAASEMKSLDNKISIIQSARAQPVNVIEEIASTYDKSTNSSPLLL